MKARHSDMNNDRFNVVIIRDLHQEDFATLGTCIVYDPLGNQVFKSESLERGWRDNKVGESSIPEGIYDCVLEYSPTFDMDLWELKNVPGRSETKFHTANYWKQLEGCIALGEYRKYLDGDKIMDIAKSGPTMEKFHKALEGEVLCTVHVIDVMSLI